MNQNLLYVKENIKKVFNEFKIGTKKMFKEFFNKETNKKQRANMWTFTRLVIPFITMITSICAIFISSPILFITTGIIAGFGAVTDYFDGKSSRKHDSASKYGKLLDQVSDKLFAGIIGINLLFLNLNYIYVLLGELLIASVNVGYKIKHHNLDITSTKMGKIKEWPLFLTLALGFLSPINSTLLLISNISIILTTIFQIMTSISYVKSNNKEIKELNKKQSAEVKLTNEAESNENIKQLVITKDNNSLLDQYKNLRDVLNEVIKIKNENINIELNNYQKEKTLN